MNRLRGTAVIALVLAGLAPPTLPARADVRVPVLLELFTSEGCSSCPPADALLEQLDRTQPVAGAELIVLSEHVDYWNALGWKDPFSAKQFTDRQYEYAAQIDEKDGAYTPELIVDGRAGYVGSDADAVTAAIRRAVAAKKSPLDIQSATLEGDRVALRVQADATQNRSAVLYVALVQEHASSHVLRGENAGRTLSHVGVVRNLTAIGKLPAQNAASRDAAIPLEGADASKGLRVVAFVQDARTGAILAVASRSLSS
jgi:hypothetical protein